MDDAPPAPSRRHPRIPTLSIVPAALLPAWWEPGHSVLALTGLAALGLVALIVARTRRADPWRRLGRASSSRRTGAPQTTAARRATPPPGLRPPSPAPAAEAAAAHVARFAGSHLPLVPTPGLSPVVLHLVTGPDRDTIVRGVVETAAQLLARGDTVLVVDAGSRLGVHAAFGGEPHWGLAECLQGRLPLLGVVQSTGRPGLFVLARGHAEVDAPWRAFGRLLDDATARFARVIVALDADVPAEAAPAFGPRELEGWWAGDGSRPRGAQVFAERVGIPLLGLAVNAPLPVLLAGLSRAARTAPSAVRAPAPADRGVAPPAPPAAEVLVSAPRELPLATPAPACEPSLRARVAAPPAGTPSGLCEEGEAIAPLVLPCDARVAERLRFLAWARRLLAERPVAAHARVDAEEALDLVGAP